VPHEKGSIEVSIITIDFETYYDKEYSLSKLTTEEYVRDDRFEVIGVGVKVDDGETEWHEGDEILRRKHFKTLMADHAILCHNTMFDGAILSWRYGVKPKAWLDTLCMARAVHGVDAGGSLKALAERYQIGVKGSEVINALGKRRVHFSDADLAAYGSYCRNDCDLTYALFGILVTGFPARELKVIDQTLRMFIEPTLHLNLPKLEAHLESVKDDKAKLLQAAGADRDSLMSNDLFAELLIKLGVEPPTKISSRTTKKSWAFAKTDEEFKALLEHPDPRVQMLVSARLGVKTTLEETRTQRFIDIAKRGEMPVPIKYYAAHTGRWGGDDKINLQNLPSRGPFAGALKKAIEPPPGYVIIDGDSSQIEARVLAWLANAKDLVDSFARGEDVYRKMASSIYEKPEDQITKEERFVGKTTVLGAGYGMGAAKFQAQLKTFGVDVDLDECRRIIKVYRQTHRKIPELWYAGQNCLEAIKSGVQSEFGAQPAVRFDPAESGFLLPSGLWQRYHGLIKYDTNDSVHFTYHTRNGLVKIYGGKVVENICQAVARCVIAEQMLRIGKRYKVVLTVHDAIACIALESEADEALRYVEECMRWQPSWAEGLPLNCELGMGASYGDC
jgi:DNA polymerase I-like protein with 3'-5' exonuclease and polymerase domains